jgi:eukaryotic-like serine/threonine-protein kinase
MGDHAGPEITWSPEQWERLKDAFSIAIAYGADGVEDGLRAAGIDHGELANKLRRLVEQYHCLEDSVQPALATLVPSETLIAGRFRVIARLGGGGFGDVYRVADLETGVDRALKILRSSDPKAILDFKNEIRRVRGDDEHDRLDHANLVTLDDLIMDDGRWMYTMELVEGIEFRRYIAGQPPPVRYAALSSCVRQIAEGLGVLHRRGLLHRDLKPSNVLVTATGRAVLLDFGLARRVGGGVRPTMTFGGTPDYMSPEQAAAERLTPSSDWYSLGVMLYEALTGELPFQGGLLETLLRKQSERPVPPSVVVPDVPPHLSELCVALLDPNPVKRPTYQDVVSMVSSTAHPAHPAPPATADKPFVGRHDLLRQLRSAYDEAETRRVVVRLSGPSGIGKSVLLREFLGQLRTDCSPLIFEGRCYQGESVPYQALDNLIDRIAQYLRELPAPQVDQWRPRHFNVLATMFPVLREFLPKNQRSVAILDSSEQRVRAFAALREMLGRLADYYRLVLAIDDLQWGDSDGCTALSELLSSSDAPPMLVILVYRSEDQHNPNLTAVIELLDGTSCRAVPINVEALKAEEATELAAAILNQPAADAVLHRIVKDSLGSPFLVEEIAGWVKQRGTDRGPGVRFSLGEIVRSRVADLRVETRHVLELVAVAGQPTQLPVFQACSSPTSLLTARDELVARRLIRLSTGPGGDVLEVYHDRIRATIVDALDPQTVVARHRELGLAFEATGVEDPERTAVHFELAQMPDSCFGFALLAGRRAAQALAFNKAARFLDLALSTGALDDRERHGLHRELADALASAGRGLEAAEHYLAACVDRPPDDQLEFKQRAAEQLLYSGHIDRGLAMCEEVLEQVGVPLPRPLSRLPLDLLARRLRLWLRGTRFRERSADCIPRETLLRIDTCATVATGLALVDIARGAALQTTNLLLALEAGEPSRVARALAMEAGYRSATGATSRTQVDALLGKAGDLALRTGDSRAIGLTAVMTAAAAWSMGRWSDCYELARSAREALDDRKERVAWERDTASIFVVDGLRWSGRWSTMTAILPELLEDARTRGDLYAQSILQMHGGSCAELAANRPERARRGLGILKDWSNRGFHVEHLVETHNQVEVAIYEGEGMMAWAWMQQRWLPLQHSLLMNVQNFFVQMHSLRARAALAAVLTERSSSQRRDLLRIAARDQRMIDRQDAAWAHPIAALIGASIAALSGRTEDAVAALRTAESEFGTTGMSLHAAVARRAMGVLIAGEQGRAMRAAAERDLKAEAIVSAERIAAVHLPGIV